MFSWSILFICLGFLVRLFLIEIQFLLLHYGCLSCMLWVQNSILVRLITQRLMDRLREWIRFWRICFACMLWIDRWSGRTICTLLSLHTTTSIIVLLACHLFRPCTVDHAIHLWVGIVWRTEFFWVWRCFRIWSSRLFTLGIIWLLLRKGKKSMQMPIG